MRQTKAITKNPIMSTRPPSPATATAAEEQVRPLTAHRSHRIDIEPEDFSMEIKTCDRSHTKCVQCCGCCTAILLILAVTIIALAFTVCHVKNPSIYLNAVKLNGLSSLNTNTNTNMTLLSDLSVKNRNVASFKFDEASSMLFYNGGVVGEATIPAGNVGARRTLRLNVTVDVMVEKLLQVSRLESDLITGNLPVSVFTVIHGKVKILGAVKKSATVKMNCTMSFRVLSQDIDHLDCQ